MSAIVLICLLVLPIVYLLGLPEYNCELIASLGFGVGAMTALTMLFVPKMLTVYAPAPNMKSGKVAAIAAQMMNASGKMDQTVGSSGTESSTSFQDSEKMLKHKSREQRLVICQEQMTGWQTLLMMQQAAALNTTSSHSASGGVSRSSYDLPNRDAIASSQFQADADVAFIDRELLFVTEYTQVPRTTLATHGHDLEMQDA
jgi:hypothetical protein